MGKFEIFRALDCSLIEGHRGAMRGEKKKSILQLLSYRHFGGKLVSCALFTDLIFHGGGGALSA